MDESAPAHRRPPALLPPAMARLAGFAALALLGALQWQRMVVDLSTGNALLWVLISVAAAVAVLWTDRRGSWRGPLTIAVVPLALVAAYASSGLDFVLLKPRRLDELGAGLSHGVEALASVEMPYAGADPWPSATLQLLGATLCVSAALLAFWPRTQRNSSAGTGTERTSSGAARGYPFLSLALLLVVVASPAVSLGGAQPVALGTALTALTVCFLWLERLPLRPGLGIAAMLALVLAGALPLASAADGDEPWFDYKSFAERFGPDEPLAFDWGMNYGPITWPREGAEVLRVAAATPSYWKMRNLDDFNGVQWFDGRSRLGGSDPGLELTKGWRVQPSWRQTMRVTLRRMRTRDVLGTGTTLDVGDTNKIVAPVEPGIWRAGSEFRGGDSYMVDAYYPRPNAVQLSESGAGADPRRSADLNLTIPVAGDASGAPGARAVPVVIRFPPFAAGRGGMTPFADYGTLVGSHAGGVALRHSPYARTWQLSKRLKRHAKVPYDYLVAVNRYLEDGFTYSERPKPVPAGRAPLDAFLFDTKSGYCQHFSGAMALLLRMGGIPARVVTGFSPGGYSNSKQAWIVRDTDAHAWVEAWFDDWGWVTVDPTPPDTPARSQIAALDRPAGDASDRGDAASSGGSGSAGGGLRSGLPGAQSGPGGAAGDDAGAGGPAWWWFVLAPPLVLALLAWILMRRRRARLSRAATLDRAVAELEAALRRAGRPAGAGTTLRQLEQRLGRTPEAAAYLRALRAGRYAPIAPAPPRGGRRALRRALASGGGPAGRLRALWALPPWRA